MTVPKQILLGALAPDIAEQGFLDPDGQFQRDADAISRLYVRSLLPESVVKKARDKLVKKIMENLDD